MKSFLSLLIVGLALATLASTPLSAQQPRPLKQQVRRLAEIGETLIVTKATGETVRGDLEMVSASSLRLSTRNGVRELAPKDVVEVARLRSDPLRNGADRGFWIGIGAGFGAGATVFSSRDEPLLGGMLRGAALGIAIGTAIDAMKKTPQTIYRAPKVPTDSRIRVPPPGIARYAGCHSVPVLPDSRPIVSCQGKRRKRDSNPRCP